MFAFDEVPVKFIALLVLFAWCTVWCAYELTRPQDGRQRVSNVLHLVMAVVMLLMVARPTWMGLLSIVPINVLTGVFAASTAWFAWLAARTFMDANRRAGAHFVGHALMFAAMTWHVAAMAVMRAHRTPAGMDMEWVGSARQPGGELWLFALVGVPLMAYLLFASVAAIRDVARPSAAVNDACACGTGCRCGSECACSAGHATVAEPSLVAVGEGRAAVLVAPATMAFSCHEERPVGSPRFRMAAASDFAMNFGMFWMSTGIMVPLLPFFALLAF